MKQIKIKLTANEVLSMVIYLDKVTQYLRGIIARSAPKQASLFLDELELLEKVFTDAKVLAAKNNEKNTISLFRAQARLIIKYNQTVTNHDQRTQIYLLTSEIDKYLA